MPWEHLSSPKKGFCSEKLMLHPKSQQGPETSSQQLYQCALSQASSRPTQPSDYCNPGQHLDDHLLKTLEPELPSS